MTIFRTTEERFEHPAGTRVVRFAGYDYGLARDDTCATGIEHVSVALADQPDGPCFTIAKQNLAEETAGGGIVATSLSRIVRSVLKGEVRLEDVDHVVAGTAIRTRDEIGRWSEIEFSPPKAPQAAEIARQIWDSGRLRQPRLEATQSR